MRILYFIYVLVALSPLAIMYLLKCNEFYIAAIIFVASFAISYACIFLVKKCDSNTQGEKMECEAVEIAEPKYIPVYIAYFVIALSIPYDVNNIINSWILFSVIYVAIWALVLKGKFSFFNPYVLPTYNFYEVTISMGDEYAKFKVFLISKDTIKITKKHDNLIRINNFVYLDKGASDEKKDLRQGEK